MNFMDFSRNYFDFLEFFRQKGLYLSRGTRGADVAHGRHVAGPREPTGTLAWRLRGVYSIRLADDGPTG